MKTGKSLRTLLAFLLVLTCVVCLFPMAAFADGEEVGEAVTDELTEEQLAELNKKKLENTEQNLLQNQGQNREQGQNQEQNPNQEPKNEEPKNEEPKNEEPKNEEPKNEEPKNEEPKNEEPKNEEPKNEEPKNEEPKVEEPKVEETVVNESKAAPTAPAKAPASGTESTGSTDKFMITVDAPKANITTDGDIKKEADGKYSLPKNSEKGGSMKFMPKDEYTTLEKPVVEKSKDMEGSVEQVEGGGWLLKIKKLLANIKVTVKGDDWRDAYYWFNCQVVKKIKEAPKDGTVEIDGRGWASFMRMVPEALNERPDVTMKLTYIHRGRTETEITIPAGSDILGSMRVGKTDILFDEIAKLVK